MFALYASLALVADASQARARSAWYRCLETYLQVAMLSAKTTPSLAVDALAACSDERRAFQSQLARAAKTSAKADGPNLVRVFAEEDRAAALHAIAFATRYRSHPD